MEMRELGSTGIFVSRLGFGSMRLPMVNIGGQEYKEWTFLRVLRR